MVIICYRRAVDHTGCSAVIVFTVRSGSCTRDRIAVHLHNVIHVLVQSAFDDIVINDIFRKINENALAGTQEKYITVGCASAGRCVAWLVTNRFL